MPENHKNASASLPDTGDAPAEAAVLPGAPEVPNPHLPEQTQNKTLALAGISDTKTPPPIRFQNHSPASPR